MGVQVLLISLPIAFHHDPVKCFERVTKLVVASRERAATTRITDVQTAERIAEGTALIQQVSTPAAQTLVT